MELEFLGPASSRYCELLWYSCARNPEPEPIACPSHIHPKWLILSRLAGSHLQCEATGQIGPYPCLTAKLIRKKGSLWPYVG